MFQPNRSHRSETRSCNLDQMPGLTDSSRFVLVPVTDMAMEFRNGSSGIYSGDLNHTTSQPHGCGVAVFEGNSKDFIYDGTWEDGVQHGRGTFTWPSGNRYIGEFRNNTRHGKGEFRWKDGTHYKGDFACGDPHGYGVYKWSDESCYEGEFQNAKRHGKGKMMYANGTVFHNGEWVDGQPIRI